MNYLTYFYLREFNSQNFPLFIFFHLLEHSRSISSPLELASLFADGPSLHRLPQSPFTVTAVLQVCDVQSSTCSTPSASPFPALLLLLAAAALFLQPSNAGSTSVSLPSNFTFSKCCAICFYRFLQKYLFFYFKDRFFFFFWSERGDTYLFPSLDHSLNGCDDQS